MTGASQSSSPADRQIRRCLYCGRSIDHMAQTAKYCGPAHRTKDTRLRAKSKAEIASTERDGGFLPLPVSQIGALGEELGLSPQDEGDRLLVATVLVTAYHTLKAKTLDQQRKIRDLEARLLSKLNDQA